MFAKPEVVDIWRKFMESKGDIIPCFGAFGPLGISQMLNYGAFIEILKKSWDINLQNMFKLPHVAPGKETRNWALSLWSLIATII